MGLRILVVDDDPSTLWVLEKLFALEGHSVETAANGHEALERLECRESQPFDVLVTDLVMPDMPGTKLIEAARSLVPAIRSVVVSGHKRDVLVGEDVSWVEKPLDVDALLETIRT